MFKCLLPSLLLLGFVRFGVSQELIPGYIMDSDGQPIPYVNLGVGERGVGTVSNQEGKFVLDFLKEGDLLSISAIGYEDAVISFEQLDHYKQSDNHLMIQLKSRDYLIEGVRIKGRRIKSKIIQVGSVNKKRGHSIGFGSKQLGSEIGARLHFGNPTLLSSFHFVVNHAKGDSMLFRLKIYPFRDDRTGNQILNQNILIREAQKRGTFGVDLSHLDLTLEGSYLFALEWVQDIDGKGNEGISFDTKSVGKYGGTYLKISSVGSFRRVSYLKEKRPCFYVAGKEYEMP